MNSVIEAGGPPQNSSVTLDGFNNPAIKDKVAIQQDMVKGHFKIGDEKNRTMKGVETSYKPAVIGELKKFLADGAAQGGSPHKKTEPHLPFSLGFSNGVMISETKQMFVEKSAQRDHNIKALIEKNRDPHFKFNDVNNDPIQMTSVMKSQFDYKGNPNNARAFLDPEIKQDLRQHHFSMGSHPIEYVSSSASPLISGKQPHVVPP